MSKETITVLSLFDGMSCGQIALNRVGINYDYYYASEIDKHAIKVTQHNYPNTIQLGSVTRVRASNLPKIDLLIGGSPCQGFSYAGKQLNFEDERSKLFFEYVRVLNELKEDNPNVKFLLENVKMKKEYQDVITNHLGVEPVLINSSLFSAQNRERLYWTNLNVSVNMPDISPSLQSVIDDGWTPYKNKSQTILATIYKENAKSMIKRRKAGLLCFNKENKVRKFNVTECEKLQCVPVGYTSCVSMTQSYKMLGNGWNVDTIVHIFKSL